MKMKENIRGYIAEACRQVGVTPSVYRVARKKQKEGVQLSKAQLEVLAKLKELLEDAERKLESLNKE